MPASRSLTTAFGLAITALLAVTACEPVPTTTTTTSPVVTAPPTTTTPPGSSGWTLVGGDEFNGTAVDGSKWKAYHNTYGDGNKELACLTPQNVVASSGTLKITSRQEERTCPSGSVRQYTSGFIGSRETGTYYPAFGRFEMRAKVPHAQGLWPAFWLRHRNGASTAEVDVMEYFHASNPGRSHGTLHLDGRTNLSKNRIDFESPAGPSAWHTWAVEISQDPAGVRFEFFMDGQSYHSYVDTQHNWLSSADPAGSWDIAINQAVGGSWSGDPDGVLGFFPNINRCAQGGTPPSACITSGINRVDWTDPAKTTYEIDYVRVYTR